MLVFCLPGIIIASIWSYLGFWPVLPIAGAEMAMLAYLWYRVSRFTYQRQTLYLHAEHIVAQRHQKDTRPLCFQRRGCFIWVHEQAKQELVLSDEHHSITLGEFLNQQEQQKLVDVLRHQGLRICYQAWWKH